VAPLDNGSGPAKARLRARLTRGLPPESRILDLFAGEGYLYRQVWRRFVRGATLDKDEAKVRAAAEERPTWACYGGDAKRLLESGWLAAVPFDVVDVDCWGSPWSFVEAWFRPRQRRPTTLLILTDKYATHRSISTPDRALFGQGAARRTLTETDYRDAVLRLLSRLDAEAGTTTEILEVGALDNRRGVAPMWAWVLRTSAPAARSPSARGATRG
jgi:hypothetical protein